MVRAIAWVGFFIGLMGCSHELLQLRPSPRAFTAQDYARVYKAWTRSKNEFSFSSVEDVLNVTATFESWEFRWAYVARYARDYSLTEYMRAEMLQATLRDARMQHRFFVTLAGDKYREGDLVGRHSGWRVLLVDEHGRQTSPVEIKKVRSIGMIERVYFPSVSPQRHTFRIAFPARGPDGESTVPERAHKMMLRFTGAAGSVDLEWRFAT